MTLGMLMTQSRSLRYITELVGSYFTETAIPWLADTVMGEVGPVTFNGASNTVVG